MIHVRVCVVAAALLLAAPSVFSAGRPTEGFREEHAEVKEHLKHLHEMAGSMARSDAAAQRTTARFIVKFLTEHILEHAKWEEAHLYPAVDRRTHGGDYPFTATMRYEHRIIGRWISQLDDAAKSTELDAIQFTRNTDRLLGLVGAHFDLEEDVLLPVGAARISVSCRARFTTYCAP